MAFASSNLAEATINGLLARSVEHLTFNQRVPGSNPGQATIYFIKERAIIKFIIRLSGEIGRRTGLKILRESNPVPVQVRPQAPIGEIPKSG